MSDDRLADIRNVSIDMFSTQGYHGTSMRDIASAVNLNSATLYHYYRDKQALFFDVMSTRLLALKSRLASEIAEGADPPDKIRRAIDCIAEHNSRPAGQSMATELRVLDDARRAEIVRIHDEIQAQVEAVIREGIERRCFISHDVKIATYLIFAIGYSVSMWYSPKGRLSTGEIGESFSNLVLLGLQQREPLAVKTTSNLS